MQSQSDLLRNIQEYSSAKVWIMCENIRSAYNVGAILRTADGTGQTGLLMAGYTPLPDHPKVKKTSLGAEKTVPWIQLEKDYISQLSQIEPQIPLYSLEITSQAASVFDYEWTGEPIIIVVGNEVEGVTSELLQLSNKHLYIPMQGKKQSLNVAEATSICMYEFLRKSLQK